MKRNKSLTIRLAAPIILILSLLTLSSCETALNLFGNTDWDAHQRQPQVFYGVGYHIGELDNTCVFIPDIGHVSMPQLEDGTTPEFRAGDLIEIVFDTREDLAVMESFPARFSVKASSVTVKPANVEIEVGDGSSLVTVDIPSELSEVKKEDLLVYKKLVEDEIGSLEKDFCEAVVKNADGERMTLLVNVELPLLLEELFYERLYLERAE